MPDGRLSLYWDADVLLSYIDANPARIDDLEAFLEDAVNDRAAIYTSSVSLVEVAFAQRERDQRALDESQLEAIDQLLLPPGPVGDSGVGAAAPCPMPRCQ